MSEAVIVFYGEDTFYIKSKINQLLKKHEIDAFNMTRYDLEETKLSDAINDARTIPFMSEKKMVVMKNAHFLSTDKKKAKTFDHPTAHLSEYLDAPTPETILIITVPHAKLDMRNSLVKTIKDNYQMVECKLKGPQDLLAWARRQVANAGLKINDRALKLFVDRVKHSTELAFMEMRKLLFYAKDDNHIDEETVKKVITKNVEDNVYDITGAILNKQPSKAIEVYRDLINYSEDPLRILNIIITKYREMLQVKTLLEDGGDQDKVQQYFHVKSGRAYYMTQNAKGASRHVIEEHLTHLEQLDYSIKSGRIDKKHAVELFILST